MKRISLTSEECKWLLPLLEEGIMYFTDVEPNAPKRFLDNTLSAFSKLSKNTESYLKDWERVMCSSVANDKLRDLYNTTELPNAITLLESSLGYRGQLLDIDTGESVIAKVGRKKPKSFERYERTSYQEYLTRLQKLKQSDLIFLSGRGDVSPYKIGFVYQNQEICTFELRHKIDLHSIWFEKLSMEASIYGKRYFQTVTNRQQALERILAYGKQEYNDTQLQFLEGVLN